MSQPLSSDKQQALAATVLEIERHVAATGWDGPIRVFALIRTNDALDRDPELASKLPPDTLASAQQNPNHLTPIEQEDLPSAESMQELLAQIGWGPHVDGAAMTAERIVLPPEVEQEIPQDAPDAHQQLLNHPQRQDLRLAAAALRTGETACAIRTRRHDSDDAVLSGHDLVPGLTEGLLQTFAGDDEPAQ